mgnify:CR=1 FL=1
MTPPGNNGALGTVRTAFFGQYTRFENLAHDAMPDHAAPTGPPAVEAGDW